MSRTHQSAAQPELPELPSPWRTPRALEQRLNYGCTAPVFSIHAIRHMARQPEKYGLKDAVRRIGRKIIIHEARFLEAIEQRGAAD